MEINYEYEQKETPLHDKLFISDIKIGINEWVENYKEYGQLVTVIENNNRYNAEIKNRTIQGKKMVKILNSIW